jgi:hypothetical protein
MCWNLPIGCRHKRKFGISTSDFDEFSDDVTTMRLGVIDGILKLWYTDTDEVIKTWQIET